MCEQREHHHHVEPVWNSSQKSLRTRQRVEDGDKPLYSSGNTQTPSVDVKQCEEDASSSSSSSALAPSSAAPALETRGKRTRLPTASPADPARDGRASVGGPSHMECRTMRSLRCDPGPGEVCSGSVERCASRTPHPPWLWCGSPLSPQGGVLLRAVMRRACQSHADATLLMAPPRAHAPLPSSPSSSRRLPAELVRYRNFTTRGGSQTCLSLAVVVVVVVRTWH